MHVDSELPSGARRAIGPLGASLLWGLLAVAVYLLFRQEVFYKTDGPYLVLSLADGRIEHPYNVLYMPLLYAVSLVLEPLGSSAYQTAVVFSSLGTALGVGLFHFGARRLGMRPADAGLATALVAVCPPVLFFATVVEHHGPFLAAAGLSFVLMVELSRRPTWALAVVLGVSTHVAYAVHGTGNLLPGLLLPWFLALRWLRGTRARELAVAALAGSVHLALWWFLKDLELPRQGGSAALLTLFEHGIGRPRGVEYVPRALFQEWLWPYFPLSLTLLAALRREGLRAEVVATLIGLCPYVALCMLLIVFEDEFGAYLLPLAFPAARLTVLALPRRLAELSIVVSFVLAVLAVHRHADPSEYRSWAAGVAAVAGDRPCVLLLGGTEEIAFSLSQLPDIERYLPSVAAAAVHGSAADAFTFFDVFVRAKTAQGAVLFLTEGGRASLEDPAVPAGPAMIEHIRQRHAPEEVESGRFRAWRLR